MTATEEILADLKTFFFNGNSVDAFPVLILPSDLEDK